MLQDLIESLYHNCRSCRYFENGKCLHDGTFENSIDIVRMIQRLSEEGVISEAVEDGFTECDFSKVKAALFETRLSRKKIDEIMNIIFREMEEKQKEWTERIDEMLFRTISQTEIEEFPDPKPKRPDSFFCKYFE